MCELNGVRALKWSVASDCPTQEKDTDLTQFCNREKDLFPQKAHEVPRPFQEECVRFLLSCQSLSQPTLSFPQCFEVVNRDVYGPNMSVGLVWEVSEPFQSASLPLLPCVTHMHISADDNYPPFLLNGPFQHLLGPRLFPTQSL